jgi:DNA-binding transcriptional ArsR family regulator
VLSSPAQFKALGHPARHRLVNVLRQRPATLRQLGTALGLAKGTVSYHLRVLREAGLVRRAGTRHVRGGTEEYFALVSGDFRHGDGAMGPEFLVRAALAEMRPPRPGQPEQTVLRHLWLTPAEAAALAAQLAEQGVRLGEQGARLGEQGVRLGEQGVRLGEQGARLGEQRAGLGGQAAEAVPADDAGTEPYGLLLSLFPADIPTLPADESG